MNEQHNDPIDRDSNGATSKKNGPLPKSIGPSDVTIRTFQDNDGPRVKELFRAGMNSLTIQFYKLMLLYSPLSWAVWGVGTGFFAVLAYVKRYRAMWAVGLLVVSYVVYLYVTVKAMIKNYVDTEIESNLLNVSDTYMTPGGTFLVAVHDQSGRIVGMVGGEKTKSKEGTTMELKRMSVDTNVHSRGLGTKIVDELQVYARQLGFQKIVLSCTTPQLAANRLYRKCGFTMVKETAFGLPGAKIRFYEKGL